MRMQESAMTSCSHPIVDLKDYVFFQEGPGLRKWQWTEVGMKVINVTNILADGSVDISNTSRFISLDEFKEKYSHFAIDAGDVVVASSGNTYGKVGRIKGCHLPIMMNTSVIRFRPINPNKLHPDYLYAFLRSDFFRGQIERFVVGSAQPNFGPTHVRLMHLIMPEWEHQRRIASIVSAYDDLIENNSRRIEILEEMARRLYEEWFVQFRFPGHEEVEFKESELGLIPEGWDLTTVAETFEILGGGTPSKSEPAYWEGGHINWYSPTDLTRSGTSFMDESATKITDIGLSRSSAKMFPPYSVMLTSRATIGVVAINATPATTNQGFITCIPNKRFPLYLLFHWVKNNVDRFISLGTGATFKEITKGVFKGIELVVPPVAFVDDFQQRVTPLMDMILRLQRKNRNLRTQRDLLLPKLISGEIDVSDIPMPT
ncbi:restriction endonuclease subunit S [Pseudomonas soli]|nr:restriction endonuclease subunit S [Pseudomonas soli]